MPDQMESRTVSRSATKVGRDGLEETLAVARAEAQMLDGADAAATHVHLLSAGAQQIQSAVAATWSQMLDSNMRMQQALMGRVGPGALLEWQQAMLLQHLRGWIDGGTELLRASRAFADSAFGGQEARGAHRQVREVMTRPVEIVSPDQSAQEAARRMAGDDMGVLPVGENDRLVGMVTDRDIALRVVAAGKSPTETKLRDVMSPHVRYCFEDDEVGAVAERMAEEQVRRLPVLDRDKRLVGMVSLGDLARHQPPHLAGRALAGVARPGGAHRQ